MCFQPLFSSLKQQGENVCLSGGARGADAEFGYMAARVDHRVIHWSFHGHRTHAPEDYVIRLNPEQLETADPYVEAASRGLHRAWPTRNSAVNNLLRRNWYQVAWCDSLYGIGLMDHKRNIQGGTAWAFQMYWDRLNSSNENIQNSQCFFFDQLAQQWWQWQGDWRPMDLSPSQPKGIWAGIGTRDLNWHGKWAIRSLLGGHPCASSRGLCHDIVEQPKVGDIVYVSDRNVPGRGMDDRVGGWATVNRIQWDGRITWINVGEISDNDPIAWESIRDLQAPLREHYGIQRAHSRSDNRKISNAVTPEYRGIQSC